jgi:hypothetical protein
VSSKLKTDIGHACTGCQFKQFCREWNIVHVTGLPYNPQRTHRNLKTKLLKNKKGGTPQHTLALTFFTLNFLKYLPVIV